MVAAHGNVCKQTAGTAAVRRGPAGMRGAGYCTVAVA